MCWSCSCRFCDRAWEIGCRSGRKWILGRKQNLGGFAKPRKLQLLQRVPTVTAHLKLPGSVPAGRREGKGKAWGAHHEGGQEDWAQSVVNPICPTTGIRLRSPSVHFYPSLQPKSQRKFLGWLERRIVSSKYFENSCNLSQWRKLPGTKREVKYWFLVKVTHHSSWGCAGAPGSCLWKPPLPSAFRDLFQAVRSQPWWVSFHHINGKSAPIRVWFLFFRKPVYPDMVQKHSPLPIPEFLTAYLSVDLLVPVIWAPDLYQPSARSWE